MSRSRLPSGTQLLTFLGLLHGVGCATTPFPSRLFIYPEPAGLRYYTDAGEVNLDTPVMTVRTEAKRPASLAARQDQASSVVPCSLSTPR